MKRNKNSKLLNKTYLIDFIIYKIKNKITIK